MKGLNPQNMPSLNVPLGCSTGTGTYRGVTVTGDTGTGTVSEFLTRGHTATRTCGVTGFTGFLLLLLLFYFYFKQLILRFKSIFYHYLIISNHVTL